MIYCVEDDDDIRELMLYTLRTTGFEAQGFPNSELFWQAMEQVKPDLILLDIMLPGSDGLSSLEELRAKKSSESIPVIMATAKGTEFDKVKGLDMGADDYLVKPFGMMEMISRIKAVLRRYPQKENNDILQYGPIKLNIDEHIVMVDGNTIELSIKEFDLLRMFVENPKHLFERENILLNLWGEDFIGESRTLDMHISKLRKKLGIYSNMIKSIRGLGYRMEK